MLRFEHIRKEYGEVVPLKDICLEIPDGKIVTLIGPSVTGKSTLLRMINGLETPTSGKIFYNDLEITAEDTDMTTVRQKIGMIFQQYNLFDHLSIINNIAVPQMDIKKTPRREAVEKGLELLQSVGLERIANKMPSQISGGQKQRVAIARALAMEPDILLFDEPTSALDPKMVDEIETLIKSLINEHRTIIIVTHDMAFAEHVSDTVIFLSGGNICEMGTPADIFHNPQNEATKDFIEMDNFIDIIFESDDFDFDKGYRIINGFCEKQKLSYQYYNNMMSVLEEFVGNELCANEEHREVEFMAMYDNDFHDILYRIKYSGQQYNPFETDSLSMRIIKSEVEEVVYRYDKNDALENTIKFNSKL